MDVDSGALGFGHFLTHTDAVGRTLLAILIAMSIASWAIIAIKGLTLMLRKSRGAAFLQLFWNATSLDAVAAEIAAHGARDPFSPFGGGIPTCFDDVGSSYQWQAKWFEHLQATPGMPANYVQLFEIGMRRFKIADSFSPSRMVWLNDEWADIIRLTRR